MKQDFISITNDVYADLAFQVSIMCNRTTRIARSIPFAQEVSALLPANARVIGKHDGIYVAVYLGESPEWQLVAATLTKAGFLVQSMPGGLYQGLQVRKFYEDEQGNDKCYEVFVVAEWGGAHADNQSTGVQSVH